MILKIPDTFAPVIFRLKAFLMLQDESHNEVNDNRRAEREKRKVNKIHPDMRCLDSELFAPPLTNTEGFLFEPIYNFTYHFYKYRKFVRCLFLLQGSFEQKLCHITAKAGFL